MLNTLSPGGFSEELQAQACCCRSYASSCVFLKTLEMTTDTRINWERYFKFASEFPCSGRGQQEGFPFSLYAWEKHHYCCHVVTTNPWFCFKMWSVRGKSKHALKWKLQNCSAIEIRQTKLQHLGYNWGLWLTFSTAFEPRIWNCFRVTELSVFIWLRRRCCWSRCQHLF